MKGLVARSNFDDHLSSACCEMNCGIIVLVSSGVFCLSLSVELFSMRGEMFLFVWLGFFFFFFFFCFFKSRYGLLSDEWSAGSPVPSQAGSSLSNFRVMVTSEYTWRVALVLSEIQVVMFWLSYHPTSVFFSEVLSYYLLILNFFTKTVTEVLFFCVWSLLAF